MSRLPKPEDLFEFEFAGYHVSGEMCAIPTIAEPELDNLFGSYTIAMDRSSYGGVIPIGKAKETILKHALRRLTIETERKLNRDKISASIPTLRDPETGESLFERLVKACVKRNRWLVKRSYGQLFESYLADEDVIDVGENQEEEDDFPTTEELTPRTRNSEDPKSISGSSSTSASERNTIPTTTMGEESELTDENPESSYETTNSHHSNGYESDLDPVSIPGGS